MRRSLSLLTLSSALLLPSAAAQAASACVGVSIQHASGTTCLTKVPRRIVSLEWTYTENLLALGIQPVGHADLAGYADWVQIPVKLSATVQDVGTRQQPSLEKIRALRPDLIITAKSRTTQNDAQLAAIAPVLTFDAYAPGKTQYEEMRSTFLNMGRAVRRESTARTVLASVDAKLSRVRQALKAKGRAGESFIVTQAFSGRGGTPELRVFSRGSLAADVLEQVGLTNAWKGGPSTYGFATLGLEGLTQLQPNNFFYVVQDDDNVFNQPSSRALWAAQAFVKSDRAYPLGAKTWLFGGPLSTLALAERVQQALAR